MKKQYWIGLVAVAALAFGVGQSFAQEGGGKGGAAARRMPPWFAKSEQHASLAKSVGEFDVKTEYWTAPDKPPQVAPATAKREMILNGYYLRETYTMPMGNGMQFVGNATLGYDVNRKKWVHSWIDNTISSLSVSYGEEKDGMIVFTSDDVDRNTGKIGKGKSTLKIEGPDTWVFSMFKVTEKGDQPTMRLTYTRKKK